MIEVLSAFPLFFYQFFEHASVGRDFHQFYASASFHGLQEL